MDKLAKLVTDISKLWDHYSAAYFTGIQNTLILAVAATARIRVFFRPSR